MLINNIAWMLRRFPVFGVFGMGNYPIQPVHVKDVAKVAIEEGQGSENTVVDVTGGRDFYLQAIHQITKLIQWE